MIDNSKKYAEEVFKKSEKALIEIGLRAEGYAKLNTPVDTGTLRSSITFATKTFHSQGGKDAEPEDYEKKGEPEENSLYLGTNVRYAEIVELRDNIRHTVGKAHFLRDAISRHSKEYKKIFDDCLKM